VDGRPDEAHRRAIAPSLSLNLEQARAIALSIGEEPETNQRGEGIPETRPGKWGRLPLAVACP